MKVTIITAYFLLKILMVVMRELLLVFVCKDTLFLHFVFRWMDLTLIACSGSFDLNEGNN